MGNKKTVRKRQVASKRPTQARKKVATHLNPRTRSRKNKHSRLANVSRKASNEEALPLTKPTNYRISSYDKTANILQVRCPDPTKCISLGLNDQLIRFHFSRFRILSQIVLPEIKKIGASSENGFVLKLPFHRNGYTAYTILKNAVSAYSDNLMYEYKVGVEFINQVGQLYPCFTETYLLCRYKSPDLYNYVKSKYTGGKYSIRLHMPTMDEVLEIMDNPSWAMGCKTNKYLCVLNQYFDDVRSLGDFKENMYKTMRLETGESMLSSFFYQIYFALDQLKEIYTHYDLHSGNILLYKPFPQNTYIQMHYHVTDINGQEKIISFPTEYIAKIIDYGRNYFQSKTTNTNNIVREICKTKECGAFCGESVGFSIISGRYGQRPLHLRPSPSPGNSPYDIVDDYFIDPVVPNPSHDLRLFHDFTRYKIHQAIRIPPAPRNVEYGYPPMHNTFGRNAWFGPTDNVSVISTVTDMRRFLEHIHTDWISKLQQYYATWTCGGDLHVYSDGRPYTFEPRPETPSSMNSVWSAI